MARRPSQYTADEKWLINQLRSLSRDWPPKERAITAARVAPGKYRCAGCSVLFERHKLKADHIDPVVDPVDGFQGIGTYAERLFVSEECWQALCAPCHQTKTNAENTTRRAASKKRLKAAADDDALD